MFTSLSITLSYVSLPWVLFALKILILVLRSKILQNELKGQF